MHELAVAGLRTDVREREEVECLRFPLTSSSPRSLSVSAELDQPDLVRMQFQPELRKTLTHFSQKSLRLASMLKAHHEVVRVAHDYGVPTRILLLVLPSRTSARTALLPPSEIVSLGSGRTTGRSSRNDRSARNRPKPLAGAPTVPHRSRPRRSITAGIDSDLTQAGQFATATTLPAVRFPTFANA